MLWCAWEDRETHSPSSCFPAPARNRRPRRQVAQPVLPSWAPSAPAAAAYEVESATAPAICPSSALQRHVLLQDALASRKAPHDRNTTRPASHRPPSEGGRVMAIRRPWRQHAQADGGPVLVRANNDLHYASST